MKVEIQYRRIQVEARPLGEVGEVAALAERRAEIRQQRLRVAPDLLLFTVGCVAELVRGVEQVFEDADHVPNGRRFVVVGRRIPSDPLSLVGLLNRSPQRLFAVAHRVGRDVLEKRLEEREIPLLAPLSVRSRYWLHSMGSRGSPGGKWTCIRGDYHYLSYSAKTLIRFLASPILNYRAQEPPETEPLVILDFRFRCGVSVRIPWRGKCEVCNRLVVSSRRTIRMDF